MLKVKILHLDPGLVFGWSNKPLVFPSGNDCLTINIMRIIMLDAILYNIVSSEYGWQFFIHFLVEVLLCFLCGWGFSCLIFLVFGFLFVVCIIYVASKLILRYPFTYRTAVFYTPLIEMIDGPHQVGGSLKHLCRCLCGCP